MVNMLKPDGSRIRVLRIQRGWPQEQLARIADVSPRTIQRMEAGGNSSFETLRSIAGAFEVEIGELLLGSPRRAEEVTTCSRGLSMATLSNAFGSLVALCQPYAPACKMLMFSSALVLIAALAIRLSPLLVEHEMETGLAGFAQPVPQLSVSIPEGGKPGSAASGSSADRTFTGARAEARRFTLMLMPRTQPAAIIAEGKPASGAASPHPAATRSFSAPGTIDVDWLASLAESDPATVVHIAGHSQEPAALPKTTLSLLPVYIKAARPAAQASSDGSGPITRSFIKSGKSTAALFTKIGGSFKRAF